MKRRTLAVFILVLGLGAGTYQLFYGDTELDPIAARGVRMAHLDVTGQPLFVFGDLYLDGRSSWLRDYFTDLRKSGGAEKVEPDSFSYSGQVYDGPFTSGDWVQQLEAEVQDHRATAEAQTLESQVAFVVPGVTALDVLTYFAYSRFKERLGETGEYTIGVFVGEERPDLECVDSWPTLTTNQVIVREYWRGGGLAKAFDVIYLMEARRDEKGIYLVYEMWADCGAEGHADVHFAAGQFTFTTVDDSSGGQGVLVHLTSFFRGQAIPSLMKSFAIAHTKSFYEGYASFVSKELPSWEPSSEARAWRDALRFQDAGRTP